MQQYDVLGKSGGASLSQPQVIRLPLSSSIVAILLVLTALAYALAEPGSQQSVIRANLPTLTHTPG